MLENAWRAVAADQSRQYWAGWKHNMVIQIPVVHMAGINGQEFHFSSFLKNVPKFATFFILRLERM